MPQFNENDADQALSEFWAEQQPTSHTEPEPTPADEVQLYESEYEGLYANDAGELYTIQEDENGDQFAAPYDDSDEHVTDEDTSHLEAILEQVMADESITLEDVADAEALVAAQDEPESDVQAMVQDFLDVRPGVTMADAGPHLTHALQAVTDGTLPDLETALEVAGQSLDRVLGLEREALATQKYKGLSVQEGIDAAWNDHRSEQRGAKATYKYAPGLQHAKGGQDAALDSAIGELLTEQASTRGLKQAVARRVLGG